MFTMQVSSVHWDWHLTRRSVIRITPAVSLQHARWRWHALLSGKTRILSPGVARRVVLPSRCSGSLAESAVMCHCVLRVIAAGPKQASLSYPVLVCACVRVFLTALLAAWVETTTPSWTAAGGGRKSRAAGRTRGGRRAESAVIWDAPSGSGRPWLPSSTFFRTPHLLNWMPRFGQSCHSGAHCRERGRPETSV